MKLKPLSNGEKAIAFTAAKDADGKLCKSGSAKPAESTAREFETLKIRCWDHYFPAEKSTLWYTTLQQNEATGRFALNAEYLIDALKDTDIEFPWCDSPDPEGGQYDISTNGFVLTTLDPTYDYSRRITYALYVVKVKSFKEAAETPIKTDVLGVTGSASSAVFCPDEERYAFLKAKDWHGVESQRYLFVASSKTPKEPQQVNLEVSGKEWDRSPEAVLWSHDSQKLYLTTEDAGHKQIFEVNVDKRTNAPRKETPKALTGHAVVGDVYRRQSSGQNQLLVSSSTVLDSSRFDIIDTTSDPSIFVDSFTNHGERFGLKPSQVSEIDFQGHGDYDVQAFLLKPSNFSPDKKYPLALLIHGGPQGSWPNAWSTRWNPAVFAEQGYIVVRPNITGSTGFGDEFSASVNGDWGGRPYGDLAKCIEYVEKNLDFVDMDRAVALGGSYGGKCYILERLA